jgi:ribosome-binding protein aMBF1 (putative translation factor)
MASRSPAQQARGRSEIYASDSLVRAIEAAKKRFGRRARELRHAKGWSREVAAHAIGIHPVHLARIELGSANITIATQVAIATGYRVELAELFSSPRGR